MNVAIIIGAHGKIAEQLLNTVEMILGTQTNVSYINFSPGENLKKLEDTFSNAIISLDSSKGILFLVDIWAGSPFNVASNIVIKNDSYNIISGVNVPMLLDIFMIRNDNTTIPELINVALQSGKAGIKVFRKQTKQLSSTVNQDDIDTLEKPAIPDVHMSIALARIDDRLIHSQIITGWLKELNANHIIIINDDIAQDIERKILIKKIVPLNINVTIFNIDEMVQAYDSGKYKGESVVLIFTNPIDVLEIVNKGVHIESVNVARITFKQNKKQIFDTIFVDEQEINAFIALDSKGIELECRKNISDDRVSIIDLLKN